MAHGLDGRRVTRLCFDFALALLMEDGSEVRLESGFRITASDGLPQTWVAAGEFSAAAEPLLALLHQEVDVLDIAPAGALRMRFRDGRRLECEPDPRFEAWSVVTVAGERIVALPGGGLARWTGEGEG